MDKIRLLDPKDAIAFATLRLASTKANPECFCTSLSELQTATVELFAQEIKQRHELKHNRILGYFHQGELRGAVGIEQLYGDLRCHKGRVWGLMVSPDYRRQGIARQLCEAAIQTAKEYGVEKLSLELTSEAVAAMQLYRRLGFRIETVEPMALKLEGRYLDEIKMAICF